jgi:hypothetical protein
MFRFYEGSEGVQSFSKRGRCRGYCLCCPISSERKMCSNFKAQLSLEDALKCSVELGATVSTLMYLLES